MFDSQAEAIRIRRKLRNPDNAVFDPGIDLKRAKRPKPAPETPAIQPVPPSSAYLAGELETEIEGDIERRLEAGHGAKIAAIKRLVCTEFKISLIDLLARRRDLKTIMPRHIAIWLAKHHSLKSMVAIGRAFGGRDHTTILSSVKRIDTLRALDPALETLLARLSTALCFTEHEQ